MNLLFVSKNKFKPAEGQSMSRVPLDLAQRFVREQVVLFVGAGVSMALKLPFYWALTREIGGRLGFDGPIFEGMGDYPTRVDAQRPADHRREIWSAGDAGTHGQDPRVGGWSATGGRHRSVADCSRWRK